MIEYEVRLPRRYYTVLGKSLDDCNPKKRAKLPITFTVYQACKFEQWAVKSGKMLSDVFKEILLDEGILEDVKMSGKTKHTTSFEGVDCETLKGSRANKTYNFIVNECDELRIIKAMMERKMDFSFWIKSRMIKKGVEDQEYRIFEPEDLGF